MSVDLPESDQHHIRVISIYATRWRRTGDHDLLQSHLSLGKLEEFYSLLGSRLPQVIHMQPHATDCIAFITAACDTARPHESAVALKLADEGVGITRAHSWLFVLPSDRVVAALDFDVRSTFLSSRNEISNPLGSIAGPTTCDDAYCSVFVVPFLPLSVDPLPIVKLLEQCAYARLTVDGSPSETHIATLARRVGAEELDTNDKFLPPGRHQIVFAEHVKGKPPDDEIIKVILCHLEPLGHPEFMKYRNPFGLNKVEHTLCAVTPNVSLFYSQRDYVENSVFLTTMQAIGTVARFRQIWHKAHGQVCKFRKNGQAEEVGTQCRDGLEFLVDELGNLELDLSFSVETSVDLGLPIPVLRIESFHRELYAAMELRERAATIGRMFIRLDASIRSELTAIEIRERQQQEQKRLRWGAAVSVLIMVAVPIGFRGTYFSVNSAQVNSSWSIFYMHHYLLAYVAAGCLALVPFISFLILNGEGLAGQPPGEGMSKTAAGRVQQLRRSVTDVLPTRPAPTPSIVPAPQPVVITVKPDPKSPHQDLATGAATVNIWQESRVGSSTLLLSLSLARLACLDSG